MSCRSITTSTHWRRTSYATRSRSSPGSTTTPRCSSRRRSTTTSSRGIAGHETTNYLIGNAARRLLEDPSRWAALVDDPSLIPGAVDETLRYDPSVPAWRRVPRGR
jgi:hypothetical protein